MNNLTAQGLISFYKELAELMPYLNICMFIARGIELSIKAKEIEIGLERLRAMEDFYMLYPNLFPAGSEPGFKSYQAKAYALCGNYDKLFELHKDEILKELAQKKKLAIQRQRKIEKIKCIQQAALANLAPTKLASEPGIEKEAISTTTIIPQEELSQVAYIETERLREQEIENRHKRHQEAEERRKRGELIGKATCPEETRIISEEKREVTVKEAPSMPQIPSDIHFRLPKRAFKTISKIFTNNWKITRADMENLFEFLGHNIDKATKSSHHIISISQGIVLLRGEEIIGIITDLPATMGGHLSLPSWEKEVPFYMRSQIENLLRAIGINQDNYSKGNSEDYMEFVSVNKNIKDK